MLKFIAAFAAALALPLTASAWPIIAGIYGSQYEVPNPTVVTAGSVGHTQDNNGPSFPTSAISTGGGPVSVYETDTTAASTTCNGGVSPAAFGMPCLVGHNYPATKDWWQMIFFSPTSALIRNTSSTYSVIWDGGTNPGQTCGGGSGKCLYIGAQSPGTGYPLGGNYIGLHLDVTGSALFWPTACASASPIDPTTPSLVGPGLTSGNASPILPGHRYVAWWGMTGDGSGTAATDGYPFFAVYDITAQSFVVNQVCQAASDFTTGNYMGAGTGAGGVTIKGTTTITDIGAEGTLTTQFKEGFDGSTYPAAAFVGAFPYTGTPGSNMALNTTTLINIANGVININSGAGGTPPSGSTLQAWFGGTYTPGATAITDVGPNAYGTLTQNATPTGYALVGAKPNQPVPYLTLAERQAGFTFRIDQATIQRNNLFQICYSGAPATGTVYDSGTVANDSGSAYTTLTYRIYNSTGAQVASAVVTPASGAWSVSVSGIPWGTGYTRSIEWANSPSRIVHSWTPFNVGILGGIDGQSEAQVLSLVAISGADVGVGSEVSSAVTLPPVGAAGSANPSPDDAPWQDDLRILTGTNMPTMTPPLIALSNYTVAAGGGETAMNKDIAAETGCPVTTFWPNRSGHSRGSMAADRVAEPANTNGVAPPTGLTFAQVGASNAWNSDVAATIFYGGTVHPFILPGTFQATVTYTGGPSPTIVADDGVSGALTGGDGTTGFTNYGFNEIAFSTGQSSAGTITTVSGELGFLTASSQQSNYFGAQACEVNLTCSAAGGVIAGTVAPLTTFAVNGYICLDEPNIPNALPLVGGWCSGGSVNTTTGLPTNSAFPREFYIGPASAITTTAQLVSAINADGVIGQFVQASVNTSGFFQLAPRTAAAGGQIDAIIVPGQGCAPSCVSSVAATAWTTDIETIVGNESQRGLVSTGAVQQIPDGYGTFGNGTKSSGFVSRMLSELHGAACCSFFIAEMGSGDESDTLAELQTVYGALFGTSYQQIAGWDPSTPIIFQTWHHMEPPIGGADPGDRATHLTGQTITQTLATLLATAPTYYGNGGDCGNYQSVSFTGPHAGPNRGGGTLFGQCLGESIKDALLLLPSNTLSSGGYVSAAVFDGGCTSNCQTIDAYVTLGAGDTALTLAGGKTALTGSGPSSCPAVTTPIADGDLQVICLGSVAPAVRDGVTTYPYRGLYSQTVISNPTTPPAGTLGYVYEVTSPIGGGAILNTTSPMTASNYVNQNPTISDGSAVSALFGYNNPWVAGTVQMVGAVYVANGYAYEVVSASVANPTGYPCYGFFTSYSGGTYASSMADQDGFDPTKTTNSAAVANPITCTITGPNTVQLVLTQSGPQGSPAYFPTTTYVQYDAGWPVGNTNNYLNPGYQARRAMLLNGNRGFAGMQPTPTMPGMPIQPLLNPLNIQVTGLTYNTGTGTTVLTLAQPANIVAGSNITIQNATGTDTAFLDGTWATGGSVGSILTTSISITTPSGHSPTFLSAQMVGAGPMPVLTRCPYTGVSDGCSGQPGGTVQHADFFTRYAAQSGQTDAARPSWNVAGVDYPVGVPASVASSLADPATFGFPAGSGCTYNATGSSLGGPKVTCSGTTADFNLSGLNFGPVGNWQPGDTPTTGFHDCTVVEIKSTAHNIEFQNDNFMNSYNCSTVNGNMVAVDNGSSGNVTLMSDTVDGNALLYPNAVTPFLIFTSGTLTVEYTAFLHIPGRNTYSTNGTTGGVTFLYNYIDGVNYLPSQGHGEIFTVTTSGTTVMASENYSFNAGLLPSSVNGSTNTSLFYPCSGICTDMTLGNVTSITSLVVDHNVSVVNTAAGGITSRSFAGSTIVGNTLTLGSSGVGLVFPRQALQAAGPIPTGVWIVSGYGSTFTLNIAPGNTGPRSITITGQMTQASLVDIAAATYGSIQVTNNWLDSTGAISTYGTELSTICTTPATLTGNVNLLTNTSINSFGYNYGSGC